MTDDSLPTHLIDETHCRIASPSISFVIPIRDDVDDDDTRSTEHLEPIQSANLQVSIDEVGSPQIPPESIAMLFNSISLAARPKRSPLQWCRKQIPHRKEILCQISNYFELGKLTAIMGPSGSGKTSLLNALSGRLRPHKNRPLTGTVSINAQTIDLQNHNAQVLRDAGGYVMQDDVLLPTITVEEQLGFIANMTMHGHSQQSKAAAIDRVISSLKLEKCRHSRIGGMGERGISGGERKRTAIAEELVRDPPILFLDEPTSGLDSETALVLCTLLSELASSGRTVILTIHQPSSAIFSLFDRILLLKDGNLVTSGIKEDIIRHFARQGYHLPPNTNPGDFILHILSKDEPEPATNIPSIEDLATTPSGLQRARLSSFSQALRKSFTNVFRSRQPQVENVTVQNLRFEEESKPGFSLRIFYLLKRSWFSNLRTENATKVKLAQYLLLSIFFFLIFFQLGLNDDGIIARAGAFFALTMVFSFVTSMGVVFIFPSERAVFLRESVRGIYNAPEYFVAKSLTEIPFQMFFSSMMISIIYFIIGFHSTAAAFFQQLLVINLVSIIGSGIGLMVGAAIENTGQAMELCPAILVPQLLIAGIFVSRDQIPSWLVWFQQVSYMTFAFAGQMQAEFGGVDLGVSGRIAPTGQGDEVLEAYGIHTSFGEAVGVLCGFLVAYRLLGVAVFTYVARTKQTE